ncbi:MAG: CPBP family intramembrane glutamic endopeptidase [Halobacteriaceae archaeon]
MAELDRRRLAVFSLVTFGVSWATALVVYLTGGLTDSPELAPGLPLWVVLVSTTYMFGPAIGNVATRLLTGEGWGDLMLRPRLRGHVRAYLTAWLGPAVLVAVGAALFFALFPSYFDPGLTAFGEALREAGVEVSPPVLLAAQVVAGLTVGTAVNTVFAFGEEFGWRAYLLPKLLPAGPRRAVLLHGVVWGVWHWPIIAMGYEYGFDYPGFPVVGFLAFLPFTVGAGAFLARVALESDSVWPAAVGHGAINAVAAVGYAFAGGSPPALLGPGVQGVVAALPWLAVAAWLAVDPTRLRRAVGGPQSPG